MKLFKKEKNVRGIILHSDQGFQYASFQYKKICESNGITISMSRKGTPIEYIDIVKDWLLFYNTVRIKNRDYI